ncbi:phage holin family protein [Candidatus Parcubacteria bacterium]|nr:MAG: phage holin family protein [Candidatus Parcubacteria bacterium]
MKILYRIFVALLTNTVSLLIAAKLVDGFSLATSNLWSVVAAGAIFGLLNVTIKPILKLLLGPIIILTLGLALILVNLLVLSILDILLPQLTIEGGMALLYGTLVISAANFLFYLFVHPR